MKYLRFKVFWCKSGCMAKGTKEDSKMGLTDTVKKGKGKKRGWEKDGGWGGGRGGEG
ncbi:hypothetical protein HmCmsJML033_03274 [Escherichia coli]|nr:hypothetical protein HmCmsJML033_03274 [Escherichia coli]